MKLKPYLKSLVKPALFLNLIICLILSGCVNQIEPTYKEEDIPDLVKNICKAEYNLDVTTKRTGNTLWIYAPLSKVLHDDYGKEKDKIFDEEMLNKLRNILTTVGRVLMSSDQAPEFYIILSSDINIGIDYLIIGNLTDIKKSYAGFIPWTEANRRYVLGLNESPQAIGDKTGEHFVPYDIKLTDFLAMQIAQRISAKFQEENLQGYFEVQKSNGYFIHDTFFFEYAIKQTSQPKNQIDIKNEVLKIIAYVLKTYEFIDVRMVELTDLLTQDSALFNREAILAYPSE